MSWQAIQQWLANTWTVRQVVDALSRNRARRHLAALAQQSVARCQARILQDLVRQASNTPFGREHDFHRIRTPDDFRRLVPLRSLAQLRRAYGPGQASHELLAAHRAALRTALALVVAVRPRARLFRGRFLFVGDSAPASDGNLVPFAGPDLPAYLRPYVVPPPAPSPDDSLPILAEQAARMPVTCVVGPADRLTELFASVKRLTKRDCLTDIWPDLAAVFCTRGSSGLDRARLGGEVETPPGSPPVVLLETCFFPDGAVAVEDPRRGELLLLANHGVYFEFVPMEELYRPQPARHGAAEIEPGIPYALALTSPAELWACLVGAAVRFEQRDPPLLRVLESRAAHQPPPAALSLPVIQMSPAHPRPVQAPHPRSGGTPAVLPGTTAHSLWSARADRG